MDTEDSIANGLSRGFVVALISTLVAVALGCGWWWSGHWLVYLGFLFSQTILLSVVIWQACDPFADAAQWVGQRFGIPGSVRGATLDAIASSMPEFFSGVLFVVVAVFLFQDASAASEAGGNGFGATLATCAGSAVYNMMLIPAFCAILISYARPSRPTIDVDDVVIKRDGFWFLACEIMLIVFLFQNQLTWWMAVALLLMYCGYIAVLAWDARRFQRLLQEFKQRMALAGATMEQVTADLRNGGHTLSRDLIGRLQTADGENDETDETEILFGLSRVKLNGRTVTAILTLSTLFVIGACYWLVWVVYQISDTMHVPVFFVAVIIAAAASSVPDTFLSMGSAMRGDDDGAVSNAFGSNIFDITICLSIPMLIGIFLNGGQPLSLTIDNQPIQGLVWLRVLLMVFSVATLGILWHRRQLTRGKAWILVGMYLLFILYAVLGSLGVI